MRQKYRITEKIDMGGMAEVYRARAISMKGFEKEVAIKRVLPSLTRNRRFVSMFLDEARLSMTLNHPNITQVFDVGRAKETYFLVMEFVDGINLRKIFQKNAERARVMPLTIAAFILTEVLTALTYAHEKADADGSLLHIVHRDVSPPNVLISRDGTVKLTDFGLAKAATQLSHTDPGVVKGKVSYLSPEATQGKTVDHRADIFSAGIIFWELLTNRRLFMGKTDMETVDQVRSCSIPPLSQINPEVDAEFESIVVKALTRDPAKRYTSAREFGEAISTYLFANRLKVTAYDLARYLKTVVEEEEEEEGEDRIAALIQDEILNLSVVGLHDERGLGPGARPLDPDSLDLKGGSIKVDDLFLPEDLVPIPQATPPAAPGSGADLEAQLEGQGGALGPAETVRGSARSGSGERAVEVSSEGRADKSVSGSPVAAEAPAEGAALRIAPIWIVLMSSGSAAALVFLVYILVFRLKACG